MKEFNLKLKILFLPFLLVAIGFIGVSYLFSLLTIKNGLGINEFLSFYWLPLVFPPALIFILFRHRIGLFKEENIRSNTRFLLFVLMWFTMGIPTVISQYYFEKTNGKITRLENINQIHNYPETKYYSLNHYYIATAHAGYNYSSYKEKSILHNHVNIAIPICNDSTCQKNHRYAYWLEGSYDQAVEWHISKEQEDSIHSKFLLDSKQKPFVQLPDLIYLEKISQNPERIETIINAARKSLVYSDTNTNMCFIPEYTSYEMRAGNSFEWIFISFGIGSVLIFLVIAFNDMDKQKLTRYLTK